MKIGLNEIWDFISLIEESESGWSYGLVAANVNIENLKRKELLSLKEDKDYNTELLPEIFTYREILWQPDVFTEVTRSIPGIRILRAYCLETSEMISENGGGSKDIYTKLIDGISKECEVALEQLEASDDGISVSRILGNLRTQVFPIIKFFIYHPMNRHDYFTDALNRLNYAVKVMLTQFHSQYSELQDPFWTITYKNDQSPKKSTSSKPSKKKRAKVNS